MVPDCIHGDKTRFPSLSRIGAAAPFARRVAGRMPGALFMKLHLENPASRNRLTGYGADYVAVNDRRHVTGLVVLPDQVVEPWGVGGFAGLAEADFVVLQALGPEVVLLGTGNRQRFPAPHLLRPLIDARIGFEVMDLAAACRTYNILMAEARRVAAALLLGD